MPRYREYDDDYQDSRADDFRCHGCELNIGRSGYCAECAQEYGEWLADLRDDTPKGGWHAPGK